MRPYFGLDFKNFQTVDQFLEGLNAITSKTWPP